MNTKEDYGSDPIGDGMFKMTPSGDVVDLEERNKRCSRDKRPEMKNDCLGLSWNEIERIQGGKLNRDNVTNKREINKMNNLAAWGLCPLLRGRRGRGRRLVYLPIWSRYIRLGRARGLQRGVGSNGGRNIQRRIFSHGHLRRRGRRRGAQPDVVGQPRRFYRGSHDFQPKQ